MSNYERLTASITKRYSVYIESIKQNICLSQPLHALNWFDTRRPWLYHLYNRMAINSVKKIGGLPVFKGRVDQVLVDEGELRRDILLIVQYPQARRFLDLVENRYFQLVSVLRLLAVNRFTFSFSHRYDVKDTALLDQVASCPVYAVHHYQQTLTDSVSLVLLRELTEKHGVTLLFASDVVAHLYSQTDGQAAEKTPCIMDGCLLLGADNIEALQSLVNDATYQDIMRSFSCSFIATLNRYSLA